MTMLSGQGPWVRMARLGCWAVRNAGAPERRVPHVSRFLRDVGIPAVCGSAESWKL